MSQYIINDSRRNNIQEYCCSSVFPISYELILGCLGERELSGLLARKILNIIQISISDKVSYTMMPEVYHGATKLSIETRCTDKCTCLYCGDTLFNIYTTSVLHKRDSQTNGQLLILWNHPIGYCFEFLISWTSSKLFIKGGKTERRPFFRSQNPKYRDTSSCD